MKNLVLFFCLPLLLSASGCTTLLSASTTEILPGNTEVIKVSETGYGFLHLNIPEMNIQPALRSKCPNGTVNGVQTLLSVREFVVFQLYEISATAYCKNK